MGGSRAREQTSESVKAFLVILNRRDCLALLAAGAMASGQEADKDWVCPMDPDYRSEKPGVCPRCGMKLVPGIPERVEFGLEISPSPKVVKPGETAVLTLRAVDPRTNGSKLGFEIVHEKLMHLFLVSEDLEYFAHIHPTLQPDGSFRQEVCLPRGGMYRVLADFYPSGSVPQLAVGTIFVAGRSSAPHLAAALAPSKAANLTASLRLEPEQALAGLETKLMFTLDPAEGLQHYLGVWAHMLAASEDLIDLLHVHPFLADGGATMQFNVIFPRAGMYRVWTQFQRLNTVNTTSFTIPVSAL